MRIDGMIPEYQPSLMAVVGGLAGCFDCLDQMLWVHKNGWGVFATATFAGEISLLKAGNAETFYFLLY